MKYFDNEQEMIYKFRQNIRWFTYRLTGDIKYDVEDTLSKWYNEYDPEIYRRVMFDGYDGVIDAVESEWTSLGDKAYGIDVYIDTDKIHKDIIRDSFYGRLYGRNMSTTEGDISEDLIGWIERAEGLGRGHTDGAQMFEKARLELEKNLSNISVVTDFMGESNSFNLYIRKEY